VVQDTIIRSPANDELLSLTVTCPAGQAVVSGGHQITYDTNSDHGKMDVEQSIMSGGPPPDSWTVTYRSEGNVVGNVTLLVRVACAT
jgi:hypothetical protein